MSMQRRSRLARRSRSLCMESLETRAVLTANLTLLAPLPIEGVESGVAAQAASLNFNITDTVTGGGSVGIDPNNVLFTSQGDFNPLAPVIFDTDTLSFSGGASGSGSVITQNTTGNPLDDYQVAVFVFDDIMVSDFFAGAEITATGSRPLAILARGTMTIDGTIDVSARLDPLSINAGSERLAGPGGGNGGLGGFPAAPQNGSAAAGAAASANPFGRFTFFGGLIGGGGGAFGGNGGEGTDPGLAGVAYGDLLLGIQGGSGGASETNSVAPTLILDGGGGGGGVELGATGAITISGSVLANGGHGTFFSNGGGGGGAGGGILVHGSSVSLQGSALLSAKGGDSGFTGTGYGPGGGGGGGRIALPLDVNLPVSTTLDDFTDVSGGEGSGNIPATAQDGPAGVVTSYSPPAGNTSYTYTITWGDGTTTSTVLPVTPGPGGAVNIDVNATSQYADGGLYDVEVKLEGGSNAPGVFQTGTTGAIIVGSGIDSVSGVLEIVGASSNDTVHVVKLSSTQLKATYNFGSQSRTVTASDVTGIQVYLQGGNDVAAISSSVTKNAKLFGGDGNDALQGGSGNDVLIGGGGIDLLAGSNGMDLLIGGQGVDALFGENDGDVLVGGDTTLDFSAAALSGGLSGWNAKLATLDAAMAAWTANQSYSVRRANLDSILDGDIFDDNDIDVLSGGKGADLFYRGDDSCFNDLIVDRGYSETIFQLDENPS